MGIRRQKLNKSWSLCISAVLHAMILLLLFHQNKKTSFPPQETHVDVAIVNMPIQSSGGEKSTAPSPAKGRRGERGNHTLTLHDLLPQYGGGTVSEDAGNTIIDDVTSPWGSGSGEFKRIGDYNLMSRIYNQVEGLLYYPAVLAAQKIEGNVNARLVLNSEGRCDWPHIEISSGNSYLRVFILDIFKKLCRQSYAHEVHGRKLTNVDFSFQFAITEHNDKKIKDERSRIVGNVLLFYRNNQQSIAQWRLGPLTGLFPLPFVNLDFAWLKENWETYIEHKDSLREFRELPN